MTYLESTFKLFLFLLNLTGGALSSKDIFTIRIFCKISKVLIKFITINESDCYIEIFAS